jgi:phosphoserine phosphatase
MATGNPDERNAKLTRLLDVSRELGATVELLPLLKEVEAAALGVLDCERATVFLYDAPKDQLYSKVATGVDEIRFSAKLGIAGEAAQTRSIINVPDAYADPRFNPDVDKKTGFRTRNMVTFPLVGHDGDLVGVLQVLNKKGDPFDADDEESAAILSSLAGVAIQRQMLLEEYAEKKKLERDLDLARDIQQNLLPKSCPVAPGFDIAGWNKPADKTGGDLFDFQTLTDGRIIFSVADATGHGIGPALVMSECRALFRAAIGFSTDLPDVFQHVNNHLAQDMAAGRFVTCFYGWLDPAAKIIQYISGGQGPLLHVHAQSQKVDQFNASAAPLGIFPDADYEMANPIQLAPGDLFIVATDGFYEWANPQDEQFGTRRLTEYLCQHRNESAQKIIEGLHDTLRKFTAGTTQDDDLTMVIVKREPA